MKSELLDIVRNTLFIDSSTIVKIIGSKDTTVLKAKRTDGTIILEATFAKPVEDFNGVFGIGNLPMLSGLLHFQGFKSKEAKVKMKREKRNETEIPTEIIFEAPSVATANFRLVHEAAIPKQYNRQEIEWDVVLEQPSKSKIAEFDQLSKIYSHQEQRFTVKTKNKELIFNIGDENSSSNSLSFTFADNVEGTIRSGFNWSISDILQVLKLSDSAKSAIKLSNDGIFQVELDTGLCKYEFSFPGASN